MLAPSIIALADHPKAFGKLFVVGADAVDGFGHVNNAVYLKWIDATIWEHTRHVGLDEQTCLALNRGMAAIRHEIDYIAAAYLGDELAVFNWLSVNDGKLRASRTIQIVRLRKPFCGPNRIISAPILRMAGQLGCRLNSLKATQCCRRNELQINQ